MKISKLSTLLSSKHQDKGFLQRGKTFTFRFLCADMYDCWLLKKKIQKIDSRRAINRCASACACDRTPLLTRPALGSYQSSTYIILSRDSSLVCSCFFIIIIIIISLDVAIWHPTDIHNSHYRTTS